MTSTTGTAQHPDVSEISDLTEGLLPPSRTADIQRHLDGCALCADVRDSLQEIRGLLGTLPGPQRMPADVAGRIDAALAAEALLHSTAPTAPADVSRETSPVPQTTQTSATNRPAGHPRAAAGPGRGHTGRSRRRRIAVLGTAFGAAAAGLSIVLLQVLQPSTGPTAKSSAEDVGTVYSASSLGKHVQDLLASGQVSTAQNPETRKAPITKSGPDTRTWAPAVQVPPCVQAGTGRPDDAPLAADKGRYEDKSAYLVVLPHPTDDTRVQAYVVNADCVKTAPAGKGELLLSHAYPRR
ncbi:hypothetical protein GCM10020367_32490 [Streptomyces sannanensis]|uniref:Zinc-finger domain-containing protein n=1 Tax=Streptomyces sannanensis TaxID=285536 RepID=A0ABP6SCD0_9ACTN